VTAHELAKELLLWPDNVKVCVVDASGKLSEATVTGLSKCKLGHDVYDSPVGKPWEKPRAILLH
jgi:hypothetical protein